MGAGSGRDRDLRLHREMRRAAEFKTTDHIRSRFFEDEDQVVGIAGHRLRLGDQVAFQIVEPEAVVHVA